MYTRFVKTSNVERFLAATAAIEARVAREACIVLGQGQAGLGKSATGQHWALDHDAVFIRLKPSCTPRWFLDDLVRSLGEQAPKWACKDLFHQAVGYLAKTPRPLVIDECEHGLGGNLATLEMARAVSDTCDVPVILLGREHLWGDLKRHKQFSTRVGAFAEFAAVGVDDIRKLAGELCEVRLADAVLKRILDESEGLLRHVLKALKNAERVGKKSPGKPVTLEALGSAPLVHDRQRAVKRAA